MRKLELKNGDLKPIVISIEIEAVCMIKWYR